MECKLEKPDDQIILGIEAKTKIMTARILSALIIPADALSGDEKGDYVFVIEEGKAMKRAVVTGSKNDDNAAILGRRIKSLEPVNMITEE